MKILKEGAPATAVVSCPHCKCEMEYTNSDMHEEVTYSDAYYTTTNPRRNVTHYIVCPCCREHITVRKL